MLGEAGRGGLLGWLLRTMLMDNCDIEHRASSSGQVSTAAANYKTAGGNDTNIFHHAESSSDSLHLIRMLVSKPTGY